MENGIKGYAVRWNGLEGQNHEVVYANAGDAIRNRRALMTDGDVPDVRIFVVFEDGTETPVLTPDEVLAQMNRLTKQAAEDKLRASRLIREERDARDAAWARFVRAAVTVERRPYADVERDIAVQEQDAARQALRDLGVDVNTLLGDA